MSLLGSYEGSTLSHIEEYILCVLHHIPMVYILCMIHSVHTYLWINRVAGSNSGTRSLKLNLVTKFRPEPSPSLSKHNQISLFVGSWDP